MQLQKLTLINLNSNEDKILVSKKKQEDDKHMLAYLQNVDVCIYKQQTHRVSCISLKCEGSQTDHLLQFYTDKDGEKRWNDQRVKTRIDTFHCDKFDTDHLQVNNFKQGFKWKTRHQLLDKHKIQLKDYNQVMDMSKIRAQTLMVPP